MILRLALRSLLTRPIRSAVLAGGFGLGVAVMAALLGIGGVILDQARAPALSGGGDVVVGGVTGHVPNAGFVLSSILGTAPLASRVVASSPSTRTNLYLIDDGGATPIRARGSVPSLERALRDPETSGIASWQDAPGDRAWSHPDPESELRAMDRFHPIPDVPARTRSWAEWLYFNGHAGTARFYLTFITGPNDASRRRGLGVRLQIERDGKMASYASSAAVDEADLLAAAPDLTAGGNRVRLEGHEYRISIDLPAQSGGPPVSGQLVLRATPGRSVPPFVIRGAGGWMSGYVVPVTSGSLEGSLQVGGERIDLSGGTGYHDHNWGFWDGVSWQWGQVQGDGLSFVYGRVSPPADAADKSRIPGFLAALGPDGPAGYATDVTIDERNDPVTKQPIGIVVRARGESLTLTMNLTIGQTTVTQMPTGAFGSGLDFLQLRAQYAVSGRLGDKTIDFTAPGSAETFRGR